MAVGTRDAVAARDHMGLMIEKNFSSGAFEHDPDRIVRDFGRKGGIAENAYNQQDDCQPVCQLQLLFRIHTHAILSQDRDYYEA